MRTVTTRRVGDASHWHVMLGYLVAGYGGLAYVAYNAVNGNSLLAGSALAAVTLALALGGVWTMVKLFRDAMYLRRESRGWRPAWTKYIGGAVGVPVLAFFAGSQLGIAEAGVVSFYGYVVGVLAANSLYLWRRHRFVGRP